MNKNDNQNQDSKLVVYELAVLIDPKLSEDKVTDKVAKLGEIVAQESGAVISTGQPRMRNLAYEMTIKFEGKRRDFTRAYFNWIKFEQEPVNIAAIETALKADDTIIRHLIIKTIREDVITDLTDELDPEEDTEEDDDSDEDEKDSKEESAEAVEETESN